MSFVHEYRKKHKQESIFESEVNSVMDSLLGEVTKTFLLAWKLVLRVKVICEYILIN